MNETHPQPGQPPSNRALYLLILATIACVIVNHIPFASLALEPVRTMVTLIHELGHATSCVATGGSVSGMTIVSDGQGHGGLTFTRGGISFVVIQAGYLGAALVGAILLLAGRKPERANTVLKTLAAVLGIAGVIFTSTTLFNHARGGEVWPSLFWVVAIALGLFFAGAKLPQKYAHFLLLFLAVQVSLNAVNDTIYLVTVSAHPGHGIFSDATNMAQLTGIPAVIWSVIWCAASIAVPLVAVRYGYLSNRK